MKRRTLHTLLIVAFAFMYGWIALSTYWTLRPYTVFTFNGDKTEVVNKVLYPGDPIILRADVVQNLKGIHCTVARQLEDDYTYPFTPTILTTVGGHVTSQAAVAIIAPFIPPGVYRLRNEFVCRVNPLRTVTIVRYSEDFRVVAK